MITSRLLIGVAIFFCLLLIACETSHPEDRIPNAIVDITINLTNQQYLDLQIDGGYAYIPGGVRGIILYRASAQEYLAFERNCSFEPLNTCAKVEVDGSRLFLIDDCCSSTFDFLGFPTSGPASLPLRQYITLLEGNTLRILN